MTRFLPIFILTVFSFSVLTAQVQLRLPEVTTEFGSGETPCLPLGVDSFPPVGAMQFSVGWDPAVVGLAEVELGDNPLGLSMDDTFNPTDSTFGVSFLSFSPGGIGADSGSVVLTLCFTPRQAGSSTTVFFNSYLSSEFIRPDTLALYEADLTPGTINVTGSPSAIDPEPAWASAIVLSPVPLGNRLLRLNGSDREFDGIDLIDAIGRVVAVYPGNQRAFDLRVAPPGIYYLRFRLGREVVTRKINK